MRIAIGIIAVLLILSIVYYLLPQGIKTTVSAIFTGSNTSQTRRTSPSPSAIAFSPIPSATAIAQVSPSPSGLQVVARASASPSGSARVVAQASGSALPSSSPRGATLTASTNLPGTGFENQPPELIAIEVFASALLLLVGVRLSKHA